MKSRRIFIAVLAIVLMAALAVVVFAACNKGGSHSHNYEMRWDENYHWEECTKSGCPNKIKNKAEHSFNSKNVCSVCGYVKGTAAPGNQNNLSVAGYTYVFDHAEILLDGMSNAQSAEMQKQIEISMSGATMTFSKDGTCSSTQSGTTSKGTYKQDGAKLTVTINGETSEMTVTAKSISAASAISLPAGLAKEATMTLVFVKGSGGGQTVKPDEPSHDDGTILCKHEASNLKHITGSAESTCIKAGWKLDIYVCTGSNIDPHKGAMFCGKVFATLNDAASDNYIGVVEEETFKMEHFDSFHQALPLASHTPVTDEAVEATCITKGKTEGSHCGVCGTVLKAQRETDFAEHNYASEIKLGSTSSDVIKTCSVCGKLQNREIYYKIADSDNQTCTIEKASGSDLVGEILLPCEFNGKPVTAIGESAFAECGIEGVTIPEQFTFIGAGAFENCTNLAAVVWNAKNCTTGAEFDDERDNVYGIVFEGCINLKTVTFGETVETIPDYAFFGGEWHVGGDRWSNPLPVESVYIPGSVTQIGERAFSDCTSMLSVTFAEDSRLVTVKDYAFLNCSKLTQVILPKGVTSIGMAFGGCDKLEEISLPFVGNGSSEKHLGYVFQTPNYHAGGASLAGCVPSTLKKVTVSNTESIGERAFYNCKNISSIILPDCLRHIGGEAFNGTAYYMDINNWENDVLYIGDFLIDAHDVYLNDYEITTGTKVIADLAFSRCRRLTGIIIPDSVVAIGENVFRDCVSLANIEVDEGNQNYIVSDGILYNSALTEIVKVPKTKTEVIVADTVTKIDGDAFGGCTELTKVTLPDSVIEIGEGAFYNCPSLENIEVNEGNKSYASSDGILYDKAFTKIIKVPQKTEVVIPDSVIAIDELAFDDCTSLERIDVNVGNRFYSSLDGILYNIDKTKIIVVPKAIKGAVIIADGVTWLDSEFFRYCKNLTSITIPAGVTDIYSWEFDGCTSLERIEVSADNQAYVSLDGIVYDIDMTEIVAVPKALKGVVTIPDGVTSISSMTFEYCGYITSIIIPNSVTFIDDLAIFGCPSLESIEVDAENPSYVSHDGILYNKPETQIKFVPQAVKGAIKIPEGVTSIELGQFDNCEFITSITISSSVIKIDESFKSCLALENIEVDEGNEIYASQGGILYNKAKTEIISVPIAIKGEVIIADGVTTIDSWTFFGYTEITSVVIPDSVTKIGSNAFAECTSLTSVTFVNTDGWWVSSSYDSRSVDVSDVTRNAEYLTSSYYYRQYDWER